MKRLLFAVLCVCLAVTASAANIGLLLGETGHNKEFDPIFATHPHWNIFRFPCSKDGMQQLSRSLDKLDLVIAVPLFNWRGHKPILGQDDTDYGAIRRYLEKGGGLVIVDGTYATVRAWLNNIADVSDVKTGDTGVISRRFPPAANGRCWPAAPKAIPSVCIRKSARAGFTGRRSGRRTTRRWRTTSHGPSSNSTACPSSPSP